MLKRQFLAVLILLSLSASADTKIKTRNTTMGHSVESTVYIKGARERSEMSAMGMGPAVCDRDPVRSETHDHHQSAGQHLHGGFAGR